MKMHGSDFRGGAFATIALASLAGVSTAQALEQRLPRGQTVCYGGPVASSNNQTFALVRITRPERYQAYDSGDSRMVRLVINFAQPKARLEDTATCRERSGNIICNSTSCEGAFFTLRDGQEGGYEIKLESDVPRAMWSCADDFLRKIVVNDRDRTIAVQRGVGSCIPPGWESAAE